MRKNINPFMVFTIGTLIGISICSLSYGWMGTVTLSIGGPLMVSVGGSIIVMMIQKYLRKGERR